MDFLKANLFWAVLGVVALAIVGFGVVAAGGRWTALNHAMAELETRQGDLEKLIPKIKELPTQQWTAAYDEHVKRLTAQKSDCLKYFARKDAVLERWFDVPLPIDKGRFSSIYYQRRSFLERYLKEDINLDTGERQSAEDERSNDKQVQFGRKAARGAVGVSDPVFHLPDLDINRSFSDEQLHAYQKMYNIHRELVRIAVDSGVKALVAIRFPAGASPEQLYDPQALEYGLGRAIPVEMVVEIMEDRVSAFLWDLTAKMDLPVRVAKFSVTHAPRRTFPDAVDHEIKADRFDVKSWEVPEELLAVPAPVEMRVTLRVYDFQIAPESTP